MSVEHIILRYKTSPGGITTKKAEEACLYGDAGIRPKNRAVGTVAPAEDRQRHAGRSLHISEGVNLPGIPVMAQTRA